MIGAFEHPKLGRITVIPPGLQPKKVWKHFYAPAEHWERLGEVDPADLRPEAEELVGVSREACEELPALNGASSAALRKTLRAHHDRGYAPVYLAELSSPETRWGQDRREANRRCALTPRGVYVVVQLAKPCWVTTAYRPIPALRGVDFEEATILRQAAWKFYRETGMSSPRFAMLVAQELDAAAVAAPGSVQDLWWLATALAYGRLLRADARVATHLPAAEATWAEVPASLRASLNAALDWTGALERIATGLEDERTEDLEHALLMAEELLAVGSVLGLEAEVDHFGAQGARLLGRLPPEWDELRALARERSDALGGRQSAPGRLWATVAIGAHESERTWNGRLGGLARRAHGDLAERLKQYAEGLALVPPVPAMGAAAPSAGPWELRARVPGVTGFVRVFVVDRDHGEGYEVTERFLPGDGDLWRVDAADEGVLVVLFVSDTPLEGASLGDLLAGASTRPDVLADCRRLSRPR